MPTLCTRQLWEYWQQAMMRFPRSCRSELCHWQKPLALADFCPQSSSAQCPAWWRQCQEPDWILVPAIVAAHKRPSKGRGCCKQAWCPLLAPSTLRSSFHLHTTFTNHISCKNWKSWPKFTDWQIKLYADLSLLYANQINKHFHYLKET